MPSPSLTLSRMSTVALGAVLMGTSAQAGHLEDLGDGAGSVEISGMVEVPLLMGVDTNWVPSVMAQGVEKEDPDEFLVQVEIGMGVSLCTSRVAKGLGAEPKERTLARFSTGFGKSRKFTEEVAVIPELRIKGTNGEVVIRDWRCVINKKLNTLALPTIDEVATAMLVDKGVLTFGPASSADQVLALVGPAAADTVFVRPYAGYYQGNGGVFPGTGFVLPGEVAGNSTHAMIQSAGYSSLSTAAGELPGLRELGGALHAAAEVSVAGVGVAASGYTVTDGPIMHLIGSTPADDVIVSASLNAKQLVRMNVAIDPAGERIAVAATTKATFTDPSDKVIEDAKKQFDKADEDDKAALLRSMDQGEVRGTLMAFAEVEEVCVPDNQLIAVADDTADGIRYFGAPTVIEDRNACSFVDSVEAGAEEGDGGSTGDAAGKDDGADKKEASRYADWADVLLKHGRWKEGFEALAKANEFAGDDCSYFSEYADYALLMGQTDEAMTNAKKAASLYDQWASQDLGVRLAVASGDETPDGTYTTKQAHACHTAAATWAGAALAKGDHASVESIYKAHMDLDERLAAITALSRAQRGQPGRARPLVLQAFKVGGRNDSEIRSLNAIVSARMGNTRSATASVDSVGEYATDLRMYNQLTFVAAARELGGDAAVAALTERLVAENPQSASAWAVYGLEAIRRGDGAAQAKVTAQASGVATRWADATGGNRIVCESAALLYVAGDDAAGDAMHARAGELSPINPNCLTATAIKAALAGDADATTSTLKELATRHPWMPLGTLGLLPALPPSSADGGAPE